MSIPDYRFLGGGLSFLNKSLMLRMLCDPSLLNWLTLVLTVSHIVLYCKGHLKRGGAAHWLRHGPASLASMGSQGAPQ